MALVAGVVTDIDQVFVVHEKPEDALNMAMQTQAASNRTGDRKQKAMGLIKGADACVMLGRIDEAMGAVQEAQSICRELKYEEGRAAYMNVATKIHVAQGDLDRALASAQDVVKLFHKLGYRRGEAVAMTTLASVYKYKDEADLSIRSAKEALGIFRETGDKLSEAATYQSIAGGYGVKNDTLRAGQNLMRAVGIYRDVGDKVKEANTLLEQANNEIKGNDFAKASAAAKSASDIFAAAGDSDGQAKCMDVNIDILSSAGKHYDVVQLAKEKVNLLQNAGNRKGQGDALCALAQLSLDDNDYLVADQCAQMALGIAGELRDQELGIKANGLQQASKNQRVSSEISMQIAMNSDYMHVPSTLIVDPGLNKRMQEQFAQTVAQLG